MNHNRLHIAKQSVACHPLQPFAALEPERVVAALADVGFESDGRFLALNSYENRVYQVGYDGGWWVVKFYRPERWSDAAILEEHQFAAELSAVDLPIALPITKAGTTLFESDECAGYRFSVFPFMSARHIELDSPDQFGYLGRSIGRLHAVGRQKRFVHRADLSVDSMGWNARAAVLGTQLFDRIIREPTLETKYAEASEALLQSIEHRLDTLPLQYIRIHGDCHFGNLLTSPAGPVFVDLDDCMMGPRVQDLWMMLSGSIESQRAQWEQLLMGYEQFHHMDAEEWYAVEALRALRMLHFAGWLARRWQDPAFPQAFPWFVSPGYWQDHISDLWLQCERVESPSGA